MAEPGFKEWGVLEVMGHRRLGGLITEQQIGGAGFLRIDIPTEPPVTQFYPPASVYCLTPTTEEMARAVARNTSVEPVHRWELPQLAAPRDDLACPYHPDARVNGGMCAVCGEEAEAPDDVPA